MKSPLKTVSRLLFLLLAVYYFVNRYPGLAFIDSGELALCARTFGVPHPTGYPLYLILTVPAALFFARPITAVTIFSGLVVALAGVAFYYLIHRVRNLCFPDTETSPITIAAFTALLFLSPVIAAQGTTNEVYGLGLLTGVIALLLLLSAAADEDRERSAQYLIAGWYIWGLSLCNHMSAVQYFPALAIVTGCRLKRRFSWALAAAIIPAVIIPVTMYAVLPIRAAVDPPPIGNWGMVDDWGSFFRHISGWQFRVWLFTGDFGEIWINTKRLASILYDQFPWPIMPLAMAGLFSAWRRARLLAGIFAASSAVNVFLGVNYSIPDIEGYYLQTITTVAVFAGVGVFRLGGFFRRRSFVGGIVAVLLVWQIASAGKTNYKGDYTLPEDYAYNICRSAPYGAVILSEIWDHHGQLYYLQQAEMVRPDLRFIDKELLRRSWYYEIIRRAYPHLYEQIEDLALEFTAEVKRFESGDAHDPQKLEYHYQSIINRLLTRCGPALIDYKLNYRPMTEHYIRSQGVLFRIDTLPFSGRSDQPALIWRGRDLGQYDDWRAMEHVRMIRDMAGQR